MADTIPGLVEVCFLHARERIPVRSPDARAEKAMNRMDRKRLRTKAMADAAVDM
jgi:hypothetical protein